MFPITAGGRDSDSEPHWVPVWMSDLRNPLFLTYLKLAGKLELESNHHLCRKQPTAI